MTSLNRSVSASIRHCTQLRSTAATATLTVLVAEVSGYSKICHNLQILSACHCLFEADPRHDRLLMMTIT